MKPVNIEDLQEIVRSHPKLILHAGRSKTALGTAAGATEVDMSGFSGMLEYQPSEYTFTALAGTRLAEVERNLAEHGQYLPFDPPLVERGATLGGTLAAGLSGPGRYRFGGVRDFILAVQFIDGQGKRVRSGGKVVKNSAGFDLPKWMVGSLGMFGALVELTFKVFPRPAGYATWRASFPDVSAALETLLRLSNTPIDIEALDLVPHPGGADLLVRIGGLPESFPARLDRLREDIGHGEAIQGETETEIWRAAREFSWQPQGTALVKIPLTPTRVPALDGFLAQNGAQRRYAVGANLAWVAWPQPIQVLDRRLMELQLSGLVVLGPSGQARLGARTGESFIRRIKQALDPSGRWVEI